MLIFYIYFHLFLVKDIVVTGDSQSRIAGIPYEPIVDKTWVQMLESKLGALYRVSNISVAGEPSTAMVYGDKIIGERDKRFEAYSGEDGMLYYMLPLAESLRKITPSIFIIFIGTNDATIDANGDNVDEAVEKYVRNIRSAISIARSVNPLVKVLVIAPPPAATFQDLENKKLGLVGARNPQILEKISNSLHILADSTCKCNTLKVE